MKNNNQVMSNQEKVKVQYKDSKHLSQRISIHEKYSVNKEGLANWLFKQYDFSKGCRILELGSGTGDLWRNKLEGMPEGIDVYLSDFSEGMVTEISRKYKNFGFVKAQKIDIYEIPFETDFFDIIIANFMLYHVPDIDKALNEVYRVLKPHGIFYAATIGDHHLFEINHWVKEYDCHLDVLNSSSLSFKLQNGKDILKRYFDNISMIEYHDYLEVDNNQDLIQYICTFKDMLDLSEEAIVGLSEFLERKKNKDNVFRITKQSGTFISSKMY